MNLKLRWPGRATRHSEHYDRELEAAQRRQRWRFPLTASGGQQRQALQVGSFGLLAALIHQQQIRALAHSHSTDFSRAIAEVLEQLRQQGLRPPRRALLVTPSLVQDLLHLPVSPLRPRTPEQMRELLQWELEKPLARWRSQWQIGSLLVGQGYISPEQRSALLAQQQAHNAVSSPPVRLGELAIEHGYLDPAQLDDCLILQAKLAPQDDELEYSWQAAEPAQSGPSDESLLSQEEDSDSRHPWLASGISRLVYRRWIGACNLNGLRLEAFYPSAGSSFACLPASDELQQLLEIHPEHLVLLTSQHQVITSISLLERSSEPLAERCRHLLDLHADPSSPVYLNVLTQLDEPGPLRLELAHGTGLTLQLLSPEGLPDTLDSDLPAGRLASLMGAALRHMRQRPPAWLNGIDATQKKKSPLEVLRSPKVLAIGGGVLVALAMAGSLGWMYWNTGVQQARLAALDTQYEQDSRLKQQFQAVESNYRSLKEQILALRTEVSSARQILHRSSLDTWYRGAVLPLLLKAFLASLNGDGVRLVEIRKEGDPFALQLEAENSAMGQEYVGRLAALVRPLGYQVANSSAGNNDSGRPLITFELHFKPELLLEHISRTHPAAEGQQP